MLRVSKASILSIILIPTVMHSHQTLKTVNTDGKQKNTLLFPTVSSSDTVLRFSNFVPVTGHDIS